MTYRKTRKNRWKCKACREVLDYRYRQPLKLLAKAKAEAKRATANLFCTLLKSRRRTLQLVSGAFLLSGRFVVKMVFVPPSNQSGAEPQRRSQRGVDQG